MPHKGKKKASKGKGKVSAAQHQLDLERRRAIYNTAEKKAEREAKRKQAKMEKEQSKKPNKGEKESSSPSPDSSLARSDSPALQSDDMAVDYEAGDDSEEELSSSPSFSQSFTLSPEYVAQGIPYIDSDLPPWDEGLSPSFYEEASKFEFSHGMDDFVEPAGSAEEISYNPFRQGLGVSAGVLEDDDEDDDSYDSPSPSAEAAARSSFDGRSSMRSQHGMSQGMTSSNKPQGHRSSYSQPEQHQHPVNAYPRFDAQYAQENIYAVQTSAEDEVTADLGGKVNDQGDQNRQNTRASQPSLNPDRFLSNEHLQRDFQDDFFSEMTPVAQSSEEQYRRAGIPYETQEKIAARVEELLQDKPLTDEEYAFIFVGDGGNGEASIDFGQLTSSKAASSTTTSMNINNQATPKGPMTGLAVSDFLAARKEHSDYATRNGETPPSYAYTGASQPTPTAQVSAQHEESFAMGEATALRRIMGVVDPEKLALYDSKLASEKKQKSKTAKKEACKEFDDMMDRNMHDMSHHEGCNCSAWVRFELDVEEDGDDDVDDWDATMEANAKLDEGIYQALKKGEQIEARRSGRL